MVLERIQGGYRDIAMVSERVQGYSYGIRKGTGLYLWRQKGYKVIAVALERVRAISVALERVQGYSCGVRKGTGL